MKNFLRYYHTIKYLKLSQILWRLYYIFRYSFLPISLRTSSFQQKNKTSLQLDFLEVPIALASKENFFFLNTEMKFEGWECSKASKLWLYNLHYFDFILQQNIRGSYWIDKWINENPPLKTIGWEPYPLSLRIINWIKYHYQVEKLTEKQLESLALQVEALSVQVEYHILGNHLFENAKSLFVSGLFLSQNRNIDLGLKILNEQIKEQIQVDGSHFELSPMYHAIILEGMLDLVNFSKTFDFVYPSEWNEVIQSMVSYYKGCLHKDKEISYFNDSVLGIAKDSNLIFNYALKLGFDSTKIETKKYYNCSGLVRFENSERLMLIDGGPIGPGYIPGHAHADSLSFELSSNKTRIIVNTGISTYERNERRVEERSTFAHNTVQIENKNQSDIWASFRVAKRVFPIDIGVKLKPDYDEFVGSYTGKKHIRKVQFFSNKIIITDEIGANVKKAYGYYHLHPNVIPREDGDTIILESIDGAYIGKILLETLKFQIEDYRWAKGFNLLINSKVIKVSLEAAKANEIIFYFDEAKEKV